MEKVQRLQFVLNAMTVGDERSGFHYISGQQSERVDSVGSAFMRRMSNVDMPFC